MNIGQASAASGVSTKIIRYYERTTLIKSADRSPGGYRVYTQNDIHTLQFIRRARRKDGRNDHTIAERRSSAFGQELPELCVSPVANSGRRRETMGRSSFDPIDTGPAWNAGRKLGAKRPLKPKEIWAIRFMLDRDRKARDRALFDLAIDSKLRGCDLVKIKIGDLVAGARVRNRAMVIQQKTKRPVQFELLEPARTSILAWLERRGGGLDEFAFPSRTDRSDHLSTRQYARLVDEWVSGIGLRREDYGTHSLRRTKAALIYKQTGNLRAVQILLGHTKIESTVRYLGVDIEDALALAEGTEV